MDSLTLNETRFVDLLTSLIGESQHLQNNPPQCSAQEALAAKHIRKVLEPFSKENGGRLIIEEIAYVEGRSNLIITLPGKHESKTVSFVGSHMDVVAADPATWSVDPFKLSRDGDKLYGRGTTDCLGHTALLTDVLCSLCEQKVELEPTVIVVFIANEEASMVDGIGVDQLERDGKLARCKNGPLFWVDTADSRPCIGTGSVAAWRLTATGKIFHSGIAQQAINSIELLMDGLAEVQSRFYNEFAAHPKEKEYNFECSSTMKPTNIRCPEGSLNQIKGEATAEGDVRMTPFFAMDDVKRAISGYVDEINGGEGPDRVRHPCRGPWSRYRLPAEDRQGSLKFEWLGSTYDGIACNLDSPGYAAIKDALHQVCGNGTPFSLTGSLPLVKELQDAGFDVQMVGFGKMSVYHGIDEYCLLSDFVKGAKVLFKTLHTLNN